MLLSKTQLKTVRLIDYSCIPAKTSNEKY